MFDTVLIALLCAAALGFAFTLLSAVRSPLRPFPIPLDAWRAALAGVRARRRTVASAALVIGLGTALQAFFTYGPKLDTTVLTLASLVWQAVVAIVLAMAAVPFHLTIIGREPSIARAGLGPLLGRAAALGGTVWLTVYLVELAGRLATIAVPTEWAVLTYRGGQLAGFVTAALLSLVRPALSAGLRNPIATGLRIALAHAPALLTVQALMLIPPLLFGLLGIELVRAYLGPRLGTHVLNDVSIVVFSTLQFLAVEAATVLFLRKAILMPAPGAYMEATYAQARSR